MKTSKKAIVLIFLYACASGNRPRIVENFDEDWKFMLCDTPAASAADFDDSRWRTLNLPHDWAIECPVKEENPSGNPHGYFVGGTGWYRKTFFMNPQWKGRQVFVLFDGVYMNADVYVNGIHTGFHSYGYSPFYYNITPLLKKGKNVIAVRVDNSKVPNDRWYPGAGIYRHVHLMALNDVHIPIGGTYITSSAITPEKAKVTLRTTLNNVSSRSQKFSLHTSFLDPEGTEVLSLQNDVAMESNRQEDVVQEGIVKSPLLWSPDHPYLYKAVTKIIQQGKIKDEYETIFGIRQAVFTSDSGFMLNGKKVLLKGVCIHHDLGCLGAAVYQEAIRRRLEILKQIGVNAIRLSHNPHAPELLDLCDEMGLLVYDEMYDKWEAKWDKWGYKGGLAPFKETWKDDLTHFVNRDRNHPSVIIWSMGNETIEQTDNPASGDSIFKMMKAFMHQYEPSRPVTCALIPGGEEPSRYIFTADVVSYNYRTALFEKWHKQYPGMIFLASETKACREEKMDDYNRFDFLTNSWFDLKPYVAGQFIWTGIDYYGESKGWPDRGNRSGLLYTTGFRKPHSYFTESRYSTKPMVAVAVHDDSIARLLNHFESWQLTWMEAPMSRHWNWHNKQNQQVKVYVMSNCEEAELWLNGKRINVLKPASFKDGVGRCEIPWQPGKLLAIGKIKGNEACRDSLITAGKPVRILMKTDKETLTAGGQDIAHIEVQITDSNRTVCPTVKKEILFEVTGAGCIAGVDNGDMADHFNLKGNKISTLNGQCLLIIQAGKTTGEISVKASSEGIAGEKLKIIVIKGKHN